MDATMSVGNVGHSAVVLQGNNLTNVSVNVDLSNIADVGQARDVIDEIRTKLGGRPSFGTALRRLEPAVLVNRKNELESLSTFLNSSLPVCLVSGVAGVGKSSVVRAALELRSPGTSVVWLPAEVTSPADLMAQVNEACGLHLTPDPDVIRFANAILARVSAPIIVVLDGAEVLLDNDFRFASHDYSRLFEQVVSTEHQVKVMLTTRALPAELDGVPEVRSIKLKGISAHDAETLLEVTSADPVIAGQVVGMGLLAELDGNPRLITLLASSLDDLPLTIIAAGLREATDIGAYIAREVMSQLTASERELIVSASVMPSTFLLDDLLALHKARLGQAVDLKPVKALLRRTLFERTERGEYFMHALISENVALEPHEIAHANALAARWYEQKAATETASTVTNLNALAWALGRLQVAIDLDAGPESIAMATEFLDRNERDLSYAGHGRELIRLIHRLQAAETDPAGKLALGFRVGNELWLLDDYLAAEAEFTSVWESVLELAEDPVADHLLCLAGAKLAEVKLSLDDVETAEKIADRIKEKVAADDSIQISLRFEELRFGIARKKVDGPAMLAQARACFELAHAWNDKEGGSKQTLDAIAEAHFDLAVAYIRTSDAPNPVVRNLAAQLRIKLDIGKMGGVVSGLYNLSTWVAMANRDAGNLMVITSQHLSAKIGGRAEEDAEETAYFESMVNDPMRLEEAVSTVGQVDERLTFFVREAIEARLPQH